jgi:hypothetical protein
MTETDQQQLIAILAVLSKLVILSIILERGLAFVFEQEWFVKFTTSEVQDPEDPTKKIKLSRLSGLKGLIALLVAGGICYKYDFDIMKIIFNADLSYVGIIITSVVAAGGSAGAITIFQGFLNINKESRDSLIAAKKAESDSLKQIAEAQAAEAKLKAEAAKVFLETQVADAKAKQVIADTELAVLEARKKAAT